MRTLFFLLSFLILPLVIYFPAFINEFGMHNDYAFLAGSFTDRPLHEDAINAILIGRILGAGLLNVLTWALDSVSQFVILRLAAFVCMLFFCSLFARFLERRLGLIELPSIKQDSKSLIGVIDADERFGVGKEKLNNSFWARMIGISLMLLPASQLHILWAAHFPPGFFTLLLTIGCYFLWDFSREEKARNRQAFFMVAAFLFFIIILFIYPPNASFVFVCTFSIMFFSPLVNWPQTRKIIFQDFLFFGFGMLVYFLMNIFCVFPYAKNWVQHESIADVYNFSMAQNIAAKIPLVIETFLASFSGMWHAYLGSGGAVVNALVFLPGLLIIFYARGKKPYDEMSSKTKAVYLTQMFLIGVILFFLVNLTSFIAKGCISLPGYRVIFCSASMFLIAQFGLLQKCEGRLDQRRLGELFKIFAIGMILGGGILAFKKVYTVSRDLNGELDFIKRKVAAADPAKINRFKVIILPQENEPANVKRLLPLDLDYYRYGPTRMAWIIKRIAQEKGFPDVAVFLDFGSAVFFDSFTSVIDFNEHMARSLKGWPAQTTKPLIYVTASAKEGRRVEVSHVTHKALLFQEVRGGKRNPYWEVKLNGPDVPWFQMNFMDDKPRAFRFFAIGALGLDLQLKDVDFRFQGSLSSEQWIDLTSGRAFEERERKNYKIYINTDPVPYTKYRIYFYKEGVSHPTPIAGFKIDLGL